MQPDLFGVGVVTPTPVPSGSETTQEAGERAKGFALEQSQIVTQYVLTRGLRGATQKEAAAATGISRQSLTFRFRELQKAGAIQRTDEKRGGCYVYVAV